MNNFTLGRYLPISSFVHRLDPRTKVYVLILTMISVFFQAGWTGYFILFVSIYTFVFLAKLNLRYIWKAMKPMLFMMVFLLVINIFTIKNGEVLFTFGNFTIYSEAVFQTLYIVMRLLLMITVTTVVTTTTKPMELTLAIEYFLKPFKAFKVPSHEIAMMISISLRFIPTLLEEAARIMKAQASRGLDLEEGSLKDKIFGMLSLIVPLFVGAFQHAEDLANAMEARGYVPSKPRTKYQKLQMRGQDKIVLLLSAIIFFVLLRISLL